ncbi:hypothetical protein [Nocardia brasiliensis]|uniref:hypothetical protein n=1 Tax=Nocardia brasiliensis TaxID=37326 RepID=UPI0036716BBD
MMMRQRGMIAALGVTLGAAAVTVLGSTGTASAQDCTFDRQLTSATVTCAADPARWGIVDITCVGPYLTYGFGPGLGPYHQWAFGNLSQGVTVPCIGGYPNMGLGILTDVRLR